ncbi:hypothetical protein PVAP13_1NG460200 [Panicum virgatum]|uniref:Uncharacterized protein n=2 Tax=Panicum virgatum TaxID=38727 RepID=A0A8T0X858_PANVG|nr:hypothetical protein PVAP13_1NG460200 [Panicum virgatum]
MLLLKFYLCRFLAYLFGWTIQSQSSLWKTSLPSSNKGQSDKQKQQCQQTEPVAPLIAIINLGTADIESMGRGRGRGKKLTIVRSHEDKGSSGEEVVPARKRRGRPQKRFADKVDQTDVENFVEKVDGDGEEVDDVKLKNSTSSVGNKRGRPLKEGSNLVLEENNSSIRSSSDESTRTNGFRQIGSRRKSKPRRAAEAGLECK